MKFSEVLPGIMEGKRAHRTDWNGAGQFVYIQPGSLMRRSDCRNQTLKDWMQKVELEEIKIKPHLDLKNAQGFVICGWIPSTGDLLADTWEFLD